MPQTISFDNRYCRLGNQFGSALAPTAVAAPQLIRLNPELATALGIDPDFLAGPEGVAALAGNQVLAGSEPFAQVYAGHQFGSWNPQLGDGRALLLGEVIGRDGRRYDIQLKGSGPTPYSRMGDGRSPLGPVLREYLVSEAMHALGVPTSRSLAAVSSGERVYRERGLPGAVLTRVASSHIRVGTFQYFSSRNDLDAVQTLADHVIERHFPEAHAADNTYLSLLQQVIERQARLVSHWMALGFIHGVMNTDNMLICGETIDYGPCAFMDAFDPAKVFSSIDHHGRYAYQNQPAIAQWNLAWFAQCLLPLLDDNEERALHLAQGAIGGFKKTFEQADRTRMLAKLGLPATCEQGPALLADLLQLMAKHNLDFTLSFRHLADLACADTPADTRVADLIDAEAFASDKTLGDWLARWRAAVAATGTPAAEVQAAMYRHNPALIPRNHRIEEAIAAATEHGDYTHFHNLADALTRPFDYRPELAALATPPKPGEEVLQTFCGT